MAEQPTVAIMHSHCRTRITTLEAENARLRRLIHHDHRPNPDMYGNLPRVREILSEDGDPANCTREICRQAAEAPSGGAT